MIDAREEIEALVEFERRGPGTDAERRAAAHLAIVGSVLSVSVPVLRAGLALLATVLTFLDANGMALTTRRLLGRRASQNAVSPEGGDNGGRLVIVAH